MRFVLHIWPISGEAERCKHTNLKEIKNPYVSNSLALNPRPFSLRADTPPLDHCCIITRRFPPVFRCIRYTQLHDFILTQISRRMDEGAVAIATMTHPAPWPVCRRGSGPLCRAGAAGSGSRGTPCARRAAGAGPCRLGGRRRPHKLRTPAPERDGAPASQAGWKHDAGNARGGALTRFDTSAIIFE